MKYSSLKSIYYKDFQNYEKIYQERFNNPFAIHLDFDINGSPAFFMSLPDLHSKIKSILKNDKKILSLCTKLPNKALSQYANKCLIDEIIITNNIEGVNSTRKEINDILNNPENSHKKRFRGLVNRYFLLGQQEMPLKTCQDIRNIYDELVLQEVSEDNPSNAPDGKIFRKFGVNVHTVTDKIIHTGISPESKIIEYMDKALSILNNEDIDIFFRISVFHYLFGYIHPFYDGNGRTSRFISSYLLTSELEPLMGYRLSYTIKENLNKYLKAFKICNDPKNKGDITPFLFMFLDIILLSTEQLVESLQARLEMLNIYSSIIPKLPLGDNNKQKTLYFLLVQATLFSELGISTTDLLDMLRITRSTLTNRLKQIPDGLLIIKKEKNNKYYSLDLHLIDERIMVEYKKTPSEE